MSGAAESMASWLSDLGVDFERTDPGQFVVNLPGRAKLRTTVSLHVGDQALTINAFVCRRPEENEGAVHSWLLRKNPRLLGIAFALDQHGDIYLVGRVPLTGLRAEDLDLLLAAVLQASDDSFNHLIRLGFNSAIRRERAWRESRGESVANLAAFPDLI
jgi:hypothetical protein